MLASVVGKKHIAAIMVANSTLLLLIPKVKGELSALNGSLVEEYVTAELHRKWCAQRARVDVNTPNFIHLVRGSLFVVVQIENVLAALLGTDMPISVGIYFLRISEQNGHPFRRMTATAFGDRGRLFRSSRPPISANVATRSHIR